MELQEILSDIHALEEEMLSFERKYAMTSFLASSNLREAKRLSGKVGAG